MPILAHKMLLTKSVQVAKEMHSLCRAIHVSFLMGEKTKTICPIHILVKTKL